MATNENSPSRRAILGALASVPVAAIACADAANAEDTGPPTYRDGFDEGKEIALCYMARVWIDRWRACGGDFGLRFKPDGSFDGFVRGMAMPYTWTPTDEGRADIAPHMWLTEQDHHPGAVKILEAMYAMVPGLAETVRDIVAPQVLASHGRLIQSEQAA